MKKIILLLMVLTIISKITGFLREVVLSYFFGADDITDAYFVAQTIPKTMFRFIGKGIAAAFIPIYMRMRKERGEAAAHHFTNQVLNLGFVFSTIIVVATVLFPEALIFLFASGLEGAQRDTAILFTRIIVFATYFMTMRHVFKGFSHTNDTYWAPALMGLPMNAVIITSIYLASNNDSTWLAYGYVIAAASQMVLLLPVVFKHRFKYAFTFSLKDDKIKLFMITVVPIMLSVGVSDINAIISQNLASQFAQGSISALKYAKRLNSFVTGIIITAVTTAMFPLISRMAAHKNIKGLKKVLRESVNLSMLILLPAAIGGMLFAYEIVDLVFGRGQFDETAINMAGSVLFFLVLALPFSGIKKTFQRAFFALGDTKTPLINTVLSVTLKLIFALAFFFFTELEIAGLALATFITSALTTMVLMWLLRQKIGALGLKNMLTTFIKVASAAVLMGLIARGLFDYVLVPLSARFPLRFIDEIITVIAIGIGMGVYGVIVLMLRIDEVDIVVDLVKRKVLARLPIINKYVDVKEEPKKKEFYAEKDAWDEE